MAGRPRGTYALSDWEIDELVHYARAGWTQEALASYYRTSKRTVRRVLRRYEAARADSSHAKGKND